MELALFTQYAPSSEKFPLLFVIVYLPTITDACLKIEQLWAGWRMLPTFPVVAVAFPVVTVAFPVVTVACEFFCIPGFNCPIYFCLGSGVARMGARRTIRPRQSILFLLCGWPCSFPSFGSWRHCLREIANAGSAPDSKRSSYAIAFRSLEPASGLRVSEFGADAFPPGMRHTISTGHVLQSSLPLSSCSETSRYTRLVLGFQSAEWHNKI